GGFTSIPISIYWTIVTLTTVGYGDISPITPLGQTIASAVMIMGYGIIAVPTGIVSAEFANSHRKKLKAEKINP
ncbi:MAG: potassium channel family protein, partial [Flavobacterium sp.]